MIVRANNLDHDAMFSSRLSLFADSPDGGGSYASRLSMRCYVRSTSRLRFGTWDDSMLVHMVLVTKNDLPIKDDVLTVGICALSIDTNPTA